MAGEDQEARERLGELAQEISAARTQGDQEVLGLLIYERALCLDMLGHHEEAIASYLEARALFQAQHNSQDEHAVLLSHAETLNSLRRHGEAVALCEAALELARSVQDGSCEVRSLYTLGNTYLLSGQPDRALPWYIKAQELSHTLGNSRGEVEALHGQGMALDSLGRYTEAIASYERALALAGEIDDQVMLGMLHGNIGGIYAERLLQPDQGMRSYSAALGLFRAGHDRAREAQTLLNMAKAALQLSQGARAQTYSKRACAIALELGDLHLRDLSLRLLAKAAASGENRTEAMGIERLRLMSGEPPEEALRRHQEALSEARDRGERRAEAIHLGEAARMLAWLKRYSEVITANEESIALFREVGDAHGEAICLTNLGAVSSAFDMRPVTVAFWRRALDLLEGEGSVEEEMAQGNLDHLRERWGARAFRRAQTASEPLYQQLISGKLDLGVAERVALGEGYSRVLSSALEQLAALLPEADAQR